MKIPRLALALTLFAAAHSGPAFAQTGSAAPADSVRADTNPFTAPFGGILGNTWRGLAGWNALLHLSGAASTYALIELDVDYGVHRYFHGQGDLWYAFLPVGITGGLGPLATGAGLYLAGRMDSDPRTYGAGFAVLQSMIVSVSYISLLKAITGRPHPDHETYDDMRALSREFNFGFGEKGIFWGWPSGHTGATMATLSTLWAYYPEKAWLRWGGYAFMAYTIAGVSAIGQGRMHWFSDAIAASLMCYPIGTAIGKDFRARYAGRPPDSGQALMLIPDFSGGGKGMKLALAF